MGCNNSGLVPLWPSFGLLGKPCLALLQSDFFLRIDDISNPVLGIFLFERVNSTREEAGFLRLIILVILAVFSFEVWRTRCFSLFLYSIDIFWSLCSRDNLHLWCKSISCLRVLGSQDNHVVDKQFSDAFTEVACLWKSTQHSHVRIKGFVGWLILTVEHIAFVCFVCFANCELVEFLRDVLQLLPFLTLSKDIPLKMFRASGPIQWRKRATWQVSGCWRTFIIIA